MATCSLRKLPEKLISLQDGLFVAADETNKSSPVLQFKHQNSLTQRFAGQSRISLVTTKKSLSDNLFCIKVVGSSKSRTLLSYTAFNNTICVNMSDGKKLVKATAGCYLLRINYN